MLKVFRGSLSSVLVTCQGGYFFVFEEDVFLNDIVHEFASHSCSQRGGAFAHVICFLLWTTHSDEWSVPFVNGSRPTAGNPEKLGTWLWTSLPATARITLSCAVMRVAPLRPN